MNANEAHSGTGGAGSTRRWHVGCSVALVAAFVLVILGAWSLREFEKGLDGDGQLDMPRAYAGSAVEPLPAGATARYEDGVRVTVGPPRPEDDGRTYRITVTFENGSDETLEPDTGGHDDTLDVRPGRPADSSWAAADGTIDRLDFREAEQLLDRPLAEDEKRTVPVRVTASRKGLPLTVEVRPPHRSHRAAAYWQLSLG
ncbi:hypothetical protein [Streptomyces sp. NPDC126503]|uniref:hypothetical protein n=1 Tax=Streptomyces sp. NPDC126503 TaxID=3155315 RepID=UPI003332A847